MGNGDAESGLMFALFVLGGMLKNAMMPASAAIDRANEALFDLTIVIVCGGGGGGGGGGLCG